MNRRKGVPCGCDADPCGCSSKNHCVKAINNASPDPNGDFTIAEGDNIEITEVADGIEIGMKNPLTDDLNIQADLTVDGDIIANGDIIQNGSSYETHAEKVYTNDDYIVMRDGAVGALAAGDYSGFQVKKYDGTNDGRLVIDRDGTARVGDVGDEQPLATRDEAINLIGGHLLKWDAAELKLIDAGVRPQDLGLELYDEFSVEVENLGAGETQYITVTLSATKTFAAGYDYFIYARSPVAYANITSDDVEVLANSATFNVIYQPQGSSTPELIFRVYRIQNPTPPSAGYVRISFIGDASPMDQPKLVSGTNIKTVGGQSLLGSGDIPAGGLNWTLRTANNDWTDMFSVANNKVTATKHIYIRYNDSTSNDGIYIPKGYTSTDANGTLFLRFKFSISSGNSLYIYRDVNVTTGRLGDNYAEFNASYIGFMFSISGSSISITSNSYTPQIQKSVFTIYTAD